MGFLDDLGGFISGLFGDGGGGGADTGDLIGSIAPAFGDTARSLGTEFAGDAAGVGENLAGPTMSELTSLAGRSGPGGTLYEGVGDNAGKIWSGVKGGFQSAGDFAKGALPVAQLGLGGLGVANSIKATQQAAEQAKLARRGEALQERAATPLTDFGAAQLKAAQAGNVPQAVQAQIDLWAKGAKQKARDYLARAGISDSSAATDWEAWIDQQAEAMKVAAISDESRQGTDALGRAASAAGGLTRDAAASQNSLDSLIGQANQMLARLSAGAA